MTTVTRVRQRAPSLGARRGTNPARLWLSRLHSGPLVAFWVFIVAILVLPIVLFLLVAFSPALLGQGPQWFTLNAFHAALSGGFRQAAVNSLIVGVLAGVAATLVGGAVAWTVARTDVPGRAVWSGSMFALLLAPSYLIALGWERLLEPAGVLDLVGVPAGALRGAFYGPFGVVVVLTVKGVPFAYLALSGALRGLGEAYEAAARVHGAGPLGTARMIASLLAPAFWSAFAIVFAESVSDFGVAATLANDAHFPVATYALYNAIDSFPVSFPVAAAVGWVLMGMAGLALLAQTGAMRGRSYRVLGGRNRPARRHRLAPGSRLVVVGLLALLVGIGLGIPAFGAVAASLVQGLGSLVAQHGLTLENYARVIRSPALNAPLLFSVELAAATATVSVMLGTVSARLLSARESRYAGRLLDLLLLTAVALPGIVFAAGYIFTYNLPLVNAMGIHLYGTSYLLFLGYVATALPATSRVLMGSVGQVQESLWQAGRVHGSGALGAWVRTVLPVLSRPLLAAWTLTFAAILLELPVSQLLYPPGRPPVSVGITKALANYDLGGGTAMEVVAIAWALAVMGAAWGLYRLLAPAGWRRIGAAS